MPCPANADINTLVEGFASELALVMRRAALEEVHARLSLAIGDVAPKRRGPGRPPKPTASATIKVSGPKRRGRPGKFTPEQMEKHGVAILALLKKSPGARSEQLSTAMKMDAATLRIPLKALISAKKIKVKGQKRGTQYFVGGKK